MFLNWSDLFSYDVMFHDLFDGIYSDSIKSVKQKRD